MARRSKAARAVSLWRRSQHVLASLGLGPASRRVVEERPGRAERVLDMREQAEALELRAEIEAIAPGTMAARAAEAEAA